MSENGKKDEKGDETVDRPYSPSPQISGFYQCVLDCESEENEKQKLYAAFPGFEILKFWIWKILKNFLIFFADSLINNRRIKRSPDVLTLDTQYCAIQARWAALISTLISFQIN